MEVQGKVVFAHVTLIKVKGQVYASLKCFPHLQKIAAKCNFDRLNIKGDIKARS